MIGGQAEYLFGSPRVTYDVDVCYARSAENHRKLAAALAELHPSLRDAPPGLPFRLDARALDLGSAFTLETRYVPLDLLGMVEPVGDYNVLRSRAELYDICGVIVPVIALEDLIRVKEHLGRDKDVQSLKQLLAIRRLREASGDA